MYQKWVIAHASSIGQMHLDRDMPCQDANTVFLVEDSEIGVAIVADGAGSAKHSESGSQLVVESLRELLAEAVKEKFATEEDQEIENTLLEIYKNVYGKLAQHAESEELDVKDLATTVILVLFSENFIICSHIGDGRAGYQDIEGNWFPMMVPYEGEEANQTVFITSAIWDTPQDFIRTKIFRDRIQSFVLLSDGCERIAFRLNEKLDGEVEMYRKLNEPYAPFLNPNVEALRKLVDQGNTPQQINKLWEQFLANGNSSFVEERDDKTIILGTLVAPEEPITSDEQ